MSFELLVCEFCGCKGQGERTDIPDSDMEFIHRNMWVLNYWVKDPEERLVDKPVCPSCAEKKLRQDGPEYLLVADYGGSPSYNVE
jgi:hypothetical protein